MDWFNVNWLPSIGAGIMLLLVVGLHYWNNVPRNRQWLRMSTGVALFLAAGWAWWIGEVYSLPASWSGQWAWLEVWLGLSLWLTAVSGLWQVLYGRTALIKPLSFNAARIGLAALVAIVATLVAYVIDWPANLLFVGGLSLVALWWSVSSRRRSLAGIYSWLVATISVFMVSIVGGLLWPDMSSLVLFGVVDSALDSVSLAVFSLLGFAFGPLLWGMLNQSIRD